MLIQVANDALWSRIGQESAAVGTGIKQLKEHLATDHEKLAEEIKEHGSERGSCHQLRNSPGLSLGVQTLGLTRN